MIRMIFSSRTFGNKNRGRKIDWRDLHEIPQVREIKELSETGPVVLFKHSNRCGVSTIAKRSLENDWHEGYRGIPFYHIDVIADRAVSNAVADRFDIRHESPQMLVIHNGTVHDHASHQDLGMHLLKDFVI